MRWITLGTGVFAILVGLVAVDRLRAEPEDEAVTRGREHVEATCVGCHQGPQLDAVVSRRFDPENRETLDAFLSTHHVADAALRADVITYLEIRMATAPVSR